MFQRVSVAFEVRQVLTNGVVEHRYLPIVNATLPLPGGFEIRNRSRIEVRDVVGVWSRWYQNRAALGHEINAWGRAIFPYLQLDFSCDSRFAELNRREQSAGVRVPLWHGASIDPYFTRQTDAGRSPRLLFAGGAVLRVAF